MIVRMYMSFKVGLSWCTSAVLRPTWLAWDRFWAPLSRDGPLSCAVNSFAAQDDVLSMSCRCEPSNQTFWNRLQLLTGWEVHESLCQTSLHADHNIPGCSACIPEMTWSYILTILHCPLFLSWWWAGSPRGKQWLLQYLTFLTRWNVEGQTVQINSSWKRRKLSLFCPTPTALVHSSFQVDCKICSLVFSFIIVKSLLRSRRTLWQPSLMRHIPVRKAACSVRTIHMDPASYLSMIET